MASLILWFSCAGHLSSHILSMLPEDLGGGSCYGNNKVDVYHVCLYAKQTRNYFTISESTAKYLLEIICCDI